MIDIQFHESIIIRVNELKVNKTSFFGYGVIGVQIQSFFWSIFSLIWTEYVYLRPESPYSVQIRKIRTRNNFVFGHFSRSRRGYLYKAETKHKMPLKSTKERKSGIFVVNFIVDTTFSKYFYSFVWEFCIIKTQDNWKYTFSFEREF